ncbi:hypothetical protein AAFF_G00339670 [Aldrovandia affinis]|uniref:Thioredoxin domain-containing protein n=1 Tax=Aldrovandia affinis TaxID=143900 RepID=A0AAD7SKA1_9TELE|nr:hypothetical protein AAFF_G00339670 [Aldrovandia affinis]
MLLRCCANCKRKCLTNSGPGDQATHRSNNAMAHRLLVRRIWNLPVRDLRSTTFFAPSSLCVSTAPLPSHSPSLSLARSLSVTSSRHASFSVQDHDDFTERVINSSLPVLVDFHAQWCGPCKILGPRLEKAVAKQQGRALPWQRSTSMTTQTWPLSMGYQPYPQ